MISAIINVLWQCMAISIHSAFFVYYISRALYSGSCRLCNEIFRRVASFFGAKQIVAEEGADDGSPSISFAGGGMLWTYYLGVAQYIYRNFDSKRIKVLCSSAGCYGGVPLVLGQEPFVWCQRDWSICLAHFASRRLGFFCDTKRFYTTLWDSYLPDDAHVRASGRLFISVTLFPSFRNKVISQFNTKLELINAIIASSCFPLVILREMPETSAGLAFDGGITNDQPCLSNDTITVSCLNNMADIYPEVPFSMFDIIHLPQFDRVWSIAESSYEDASRSAKFMAPAWQAIALRDQGSA